MTEPQRPSPQLFRIAPSRWEVDPRWLQVAFLLSFLGLGIQLSTIPWWEPALTLAAAVGTQALCMGQRRFRDPKAYLSPLITGLGLALLLRTDLVWIPPLAGCLAIGSKFLLRFRGKHLFNPANLGLVAMLTLTSHAWCSPSQWREQTLVIVWFGVFGLAVSARAFRSDISLAFLASWFLLKAGRVLYLGQRVEVLGHQMLTGGLIVFAFFMISDPKTTPDHRLGRLLFAASVAVLAFTLQHGFWVQTALFWALFALSPFTPLFDRIFKGARFTWPEPSLRPLVPDAR